MATNTAHPLLTPARLAHPDTYLAAIDHIHGLTPLDASTRAALLALAMHAPHAPLLFALSTIARGDAMLLGLLTVLGLDALRSWGGRAPGAGKRKRGADTAPASDDEGDTNTPANPDDDDTEQPPAAPGLATTITLLQPLLAHPLLNVAHAIPRALAAPTPDARARRPPTPDRLRALLDARHSRACALTACNSHALLHGAHVLPYSLFHGPRRAEGYGWALLAVLIGEQARDAVFAAGYADTRADAALHLRNMVLLDVKLHHYFDAGTVTLTPLAQPAQREHFRDYVFNVHVNVPATAGQRNATLVPTPSPTPAPPAYAPDDLRGLTTTRPRAARRQFALLAAPGQDAGYTVTRATIAAPRPMRDADTYRLGTADPAALPLPAGKMFAVKVLVWRLLGMVDMARLRAALRAVDVGGAIVPGGNPAKPQARKRGKTAAVTEIDTIIDDDTTDGGDDSDEGPGAGASAGKGNDAPSGMDAPPRSSNARGNSPPSPPSRSRPRAKNGPNDAHSPAESPSPPAASSKPAATAAAATAHAFTFTPPTSVAGSAPGSRVVSGSEPKAGGTATPATAPASLISPPPHALDTPATPATAADHPATQPKELDHGYDPSRIAAKETAPSLNTLTHAQHLHVLRLLLPGDLIPPSVATNTQWEKALAARASEPWTRAMRRTCRRLEEGPIGVGGYMDRAEEAFWMGEDSEGQEEGDEQSEDEEALE
ncbi:hypothetical protein DFH27DRAFT_583092 [Peziza echinospora]|nr:hypothetical protein DFH27DRAFT_583092 [Peziza echinospora]